MPEADHFHICSDSKNALPFSAANQGNYCLQDAAKDTITQSD